MSNEMETEVSSQPFKVEIKTAFDGKTQTYSINLCEIDQLTKEKDLIQTIFDNTQNTITDILDNALKEHSSILVNLNLEGTFDDFEYIKFNLDAKKEISSADMIKQYLIKAKEKILLKFKNYDSKYEGKKQLLYLHLHVHKVVTIENNLELPKKFENYIIDCKSSDEMSFKWSILVALYPDMKKSNELVKLNELILDDIDYPVQLDDIPRIEQNSIFSINVYTLKFSYKTNSFEIEGPVYHTKNRKEKHINLLLINNNIKIRYYYIKDLKSLINPKSCKEYFCDGCLNFFDELVSFERHQQEECLKVKTVFPAEKTVKFRNQKILGKYAPFVVYADFNAVLQLIECEQERKDKNKHTSTWTKNIYKHVPHSYWYYIKCINDEYSQKSMSSYRGQDCVGQFVDNLVKDFEECLLKYKKRYPEVIIEFVPAFFHDLQNYDGHFILQNSKCDSVIDKLNTYFSIYKKCTIDSKHTQIRFLDTCKFLSESLLTSVKNLIHEDFREIKKICNDDNQLALLIDRDGFPHFNIESVEHLSLSGKHNFRDFLSKSKVNSKQYSRANEIWDRFKCNTIGDYLDYYLKTQVMLLADVFEKLRRFCMENYELDPAYYYSLAGFSWDAMLKDLPLELELLTDVEMLLFIKKGIRGGYLHCNKQHAVASNKYLSSECKGGSKAESYIMFFDANNAYGYAMCKSLPYGGFEWVKKESDINECLKLLENYNEESEDSETGYILEVDLSYPMEIHKKHLDYPFCPEKKTIIGHKRLVADTTAKRRYVIHFAYLALCKKHGLKIDRVHRVLKFKQARWLKKYIEDNNEKRIQSKNASEKLFFKMMNITVYGKTIVNVENFENIVLLDCWENKNKLKRGAFDYIVRPDYNSHTICSNNMVKIKQHNTKLTFKYPIYAGFSILDLAKTRMYEFYYNFMKEKFGDNLSLLYTDNDSFIFEVKGTDCYKIIKEDGNSFFDTSGYEPNNPFGIPQRNKLKIGYFKDVMEGAVIKEYVGLRPKMYIVDAEKVDKKINSVIPYQVCKKVKRAALGVPTHIRDKYEVNHYKKCLVSNETLYDTFRRIEVVDHDVYTQEARKKCLHFGNNM